MTVFEACRCVTSKNWDSHSLEYLYISARFGWIYSLALISLFFFCFYPIAFHQTSPKHFYHPNSLLSSQKNPVQPLTVGRRIDVGVTWKYRFWSDLFPLHVDFAAVDLTFWRTKSVKACLFFEGSNRCDGAGGRFIPNKCVKRYLRLLFLFKPFCQFFN